jgi:hypothetical protein
MRNLTASQRVATLHIAKMEKEAFLLEAIKEKLLLGTLTTEAKRQSKEMSSEARKGMRMFFNDSGINNPKKFADYMASGKVDLKDPFSKLLHRVCKGKSVGEVGDIGGRFFSAYYKKDIEGMADVVGVDKKVMMITCMHYMKDSPKINSLVKKGEDRLNKALYDRVQETYQLYVEEKARQNPNQKRGSDAIWSKEFAQFCKDLWQNSGDASKFVDTLLTYLNDNIIKDMLDGIVAKVPIEHEMSAAIMKGFFGVVGSVASWVEWALGGAVWALGYVFTMLVDVEKGDVLPYVWSTVREVLQIGWVILSHGIKLCFNVLSTGLVLTAGFLGPAFIVKFLLLTVVAYRIYLFMAWGNYKITELPKVIFWDFPKAMLKKLWDLVTNGVYKMDSKSKKVVIQEAEKAKKELPAPGRGRNRYSMP